MTSITHPWEVCSSSGVVVSRHQTEQAAWASYHNRLRRTSRSLNKGGLHGGLDVSRFMELYVRGPQ